MEQRAEPSRVFSAIRSGGMRILVMISPGILADVARNPIPSPRSTSSEVEFYPDLPILRALLTSPQKTVE